MTHDFGGLCDHPRRYGQDADMAAQSYTTGGKDLKGYNSGVEHLTVEL